MYNPVTFSAVSDTNPGYKDPTGRVVNAGPAFKHRRACANDSSCSQTFEAYTDNCLVTR
jgi:hypothetical protein